MKTKISPNKTRLQNLSGFSSKVGVAISEFLHGRKHTKYPSDFAQSNIENLGHLELICSDLKAYTTYSVILKNILKNASMFKGQHLSMLSILGL